MMRCPPFALVSALAWAGAGCGGAPGGPPVAAAPSTATRATASSDAAPASTGDAPLASAAASPPAAPGLKIEDVVVGTGDTAAAGDHVTVHYTGTLTDGTEFDSSRKRPRPFDFTLGVGQVIKGWDQGVVGMKVGGRRKLVVPSEMGYGERGQPPVIPANATLLFDVELLAVDHSTAARALGPRVISARHILIEYMGARKAEPSIVRTKQQARGVAEEVLRRAKAGDDFSRLAVEYSDEPGAGARGGALGRFGRGQWVPEFDAAAFALKPGEISGIVETPFGFHVIQRLE